MFGTGAIESVVGSFPGILDAAVCGVPNELGNNELVAVIVSGAPVDVEAVRAHCREHLPTHLTQMRFMIAEGLPRNAMGKIDRGRLAESLRGVTIRG